MATKKARTDANGDAVAAPVPIDDPISQAPAEAEREESSNQPVHIVRFGPVRACIWRNHDGERFWYQVTVNRLYKGHDDQWHSTVACSPVIGPPEVGVPRYTVPWRDPCRSDGPPTK